LKRGDVVTTVLPGDYGKPRPAVVVQSDRLKHVGSTILCPFTSDLTPSGAIRLTIEPSVENGLKVASSLMTDKVSAIPREKCGDVIGGLDESTMQRVDEALMFVLGLAD
jgi:mRNA interferase MazF